MDVPCSSHRSSREGSLASSRIPVAARQREHVAERLIALRAILSAVAEELAGARRQAAALGVENRGLVAEVRRLQRRHAMGISPTDRPTEGIVCRS
jgi:hypothetical protein